MPFGICFVSNGAETPTERRVREKGGAEHFQRMLRALLPRTWAASGRAPALLGRFFSRDGGHDLKSRISVVGVVHQCAFAGATASDVHPRRAPSLSAGPAATEPTRSASETGPAATRTELNPGTTEDHAMRLFASEAARHALPSDWVFSLDSAKSRLGVCNYQTRTISLSKRFIGSATEAEVVNTIRHEIAHALTPGDGHGARWRRMALSIGSDGKRCSNFDMGGHTWRLVCPCGAVDVKRHRRARANLKKSCTSCHGLLTYVLA